MLAFKPLFTEGERGADTALAGSDDNEVSHCSFPNMMRILPSER